MSSHLEGQPAGTEVSCAKKLEVSVRFLGAGEISNHNLELKWTYSDEERNNDGRFPEKQTLLEFRKGFTKQIISLRHLLCPEGSLETHPESRYDGGYSSLKLKMFT